MPDSFALSENGKLYVANGVERMLRWDGLAGQAELAGVDPPLTGVTVGGSGVGGIVGDYYAYVRFVTKDNEFSNLSPISTVYTPSSSMGTITDITQATPMVVTVASAHNLLDDAVVKIAGVGGATTANSTWTVTVVSATSFSLNDSVAPTRAYNGGGTFTAGVSTIAYTAVPVPTDPKVTKKQILRNTDGQTTTFYVDVESEALLSTSLSSTRLDSELSVQTSVPILNSDGSLNANRFTVPPNHKAFLANHLGRMFAAGEVTYSEGAVKVTAGSTTVTGIGTEWTEEMGDRFLYVSGADLKYEIDSVSESAQTLTLLSPYQGVDNAYAEYAIRPAPAERRLVYYSEATLPDAWPAVNALSVQDDNDDITGLMVSGSFLYILERRHIYRFTFQADPAVDGYVFLSAPSRGVINNRCWVQVNGTTYMLDEQGVHAFDGGRESESVSDAIQEIFRDDDRYFRINWAASRWFHAVLYPTQHTVRWFVALSGSYLPRHALCYQYELKRWWVEEFSVPVGSSAQAFPEAGRPVVYLGTSGRRILLHGETELDGPDPSACTLRGTVTSSTLMSLTDSAAGFTSANTVGHPVSIYDGPGKGQTRLIVAVSGTTTVTLDRPWAEMPGTSPTSGNTSKYQIGGVNWLARFGWFRYVQDEGSNARQVEVVFEPLESLSDTLKPQGTLRLYRDRQKNAIAYRTPYDFRDTHAVRSERDSADLAFDLSNEVGMAMKKMDGHKDSYFQATRWVAPEVSGVSGDERVRLYEITLDGVVE